MSLLRRNYLINLLLLLLISNNGYADVGFGFSHTTGNSGNYYGFSIGDFNHFDQSFKDRFDMYHYGYGRSTLTVGNGVELKLSANSGITLYGLKDHKEDLFAHVGVDVGGRLLLNSNTAVKSYYEWMPALVLGPQWRVGTFTGMVASKWGIAIGNYDRPNLLPDLYPSYGLGVYLNNKVLDFGADYARFGDNFLLSLDAVYKFDNKSLNLRIDTRDNYPGGLKENNISLLFKTGIF